MFCGFRILLYSSTCQPNGQVHHCTWSEMFMSLLSYYCKCHGHTSQYTTTDEWCFRVHDKFTIATSKQDQTHAYMQYSCPHEQLNRILNTVNFKLVVHKSAILKCELTNHIRQTWQFCWMWLVNLQFKVALLDNQPEIYGTRFCWIIS